MRGPLMLVVGAVVAAAAASYSSVVVDASANTNTKCNELQNCQTCLNPPDPSLNCGWCSPSPATSAAGQPLTQCMDHTSHGWYCSHLYMHDGCVAGYVCNHTAGQCMLGQPGEGDTKEHCELTCHKKPPPTKQYTCNTTSFMCVEAAAGHEKGDCTKACSNSTPAELVGLWRGLSIQENFTVGEWEMNFTTQAVTWGPHATPTKYAAVVATTSPTHVRLIMTAPASEAGGVRFASFSSPGFPTGPETGSMSVAVQRPNSHQTPPDDVSFAMGDPNFDVYVLHRCNSWKAQCNFAPAWQPKLLAARRRALKEQLELEEFAEMLATASVGRSMADDACTVHKDCDSCLVDPLKVCGWCDGIITFGDNTTCGEDGNGCCGGASSFSKCRSAHGSYWKTCPVVCDRTDYTAPFCRAAHNKELNQSKIQKFADCATVEKWEACIFGRYCNTTAKQCVPVHSKAECAKIPGCDPDHPQCTNCTTPHTTYVYCDPDHGCATAANKSACAANPHCDPDHPICDPTKCTAPPPFYTCDTGYHCTAHTGTPPPHAYNDSKTCEKACYDHDVSGVWRGLRIDNGFIVDEWDFDFAQPKVTYTSRHTGDTYTGTYAVGTAMDVDGFGSFVITVTLATGEVLEGLYSVDPTHALGPITRFLYLGLPLHTGDTTTTYDDAMNTTKQEFVLIACKRGVAHCDFSSAAPAIA